MKQPRFNIRAFGQSSWRKIQDQWTELDKETGVFYKSVMENYPHAGEQDETRQMGICKTVQSM